MLSRERAQEPGGKGVVTLTLALEIGERVRCSPTACDPADFVRFSEDEAENRRILREEWVSRSGCALFCWSADGAV